MLTIAYLVLSDCNVYLLVSDVSEPYVGGLGYTSVIFDKYVVQINTLIYRI
jgi:hypothetical protein